MALVRWNQPYSTSFNLLQEVHDDIARFLEGTPMRTFAPSRWGLDTGAYVPPVDLYDQTEQLVVRADLPGLDKNSIEVSVVRNTLTIKGEKRDDHTEGRTRSERTFGSFSRSLALPAKVDSEKVTAAYRNGVLEITLPKAVESKPHKIAVNA